jgi:hypothetical protein
LFTVAMYIRIETGLQYKRSKGCLMNLI